jgi:hypothetical protein
MVSYFNFKIGIPDCNNFKKIYDNFSLNIINNSTLVTDDLDLEFAIKCKKIISCGSLMKSFINTIIHSNIYIIKSSNTYNGWLYKILINIANNKINKLWYGFLLITIPITEFFIISKLFFSNVLLAMFIFFILSITKFPKIFLFKYTFFLLMETNNFVNIYNIIYSFNIHNYQLKKTFISHGVAKSFGSLRLGLFLFCFVNFLYFYNKFSLIIQLIYIGLLFKYSINLLDLNRYIILLYIFNGFLGYLFI